MTRYIAFLVSFALFACTAQPSTLILVGLCGDDASVDAVAEDAASAVTDAAPDAMAAPIGILLGGQSNAQGRKVCTNVTVASGACGTYSYSTILDEESDTPLTPFAWQIQRGPVSLSPRAGNNFGVEMPIGTALHALGHDVGFAKAAIGSTSLALYWQNHCYTTGCTPVVYPTVAGGAADTTLPAKLIAQGEALEALGYQIRFIIWIQGEHDAAYSSYAAHYAENLTTHFNTLHARWPNAKIIYNQLDSDFVLNATAAVRTAQASVATSYPHNADGSPIVYMISSEGLSHDSAHFEADGLWQLGLRFVDAITPLL